MDDAVRKPCHDVEEGVLMSGENVADVGTIEDVFQSGQDTDPYWRTPTAGNESIGEKISHVP